MLLNYGASYREGLIGKREDVGFRIARNAE